MKQILISIALAFMTLFAFSQNIPAGMRMELAEVGEDNNQYSVFSYLDEDGTFGYYMGIGHEIPLLEIFRDDITDALFNHIDETCLWMGNTADEASAFLDSLMEMFDEENGTIREFPCRLSTGAEMLGDSSVANCIIVKRFLQAKRLCFQFRSGNHTAEADVTKSSLKSLRWSFNVGRKLHPDW